MLHIASFFVSISPMMMVVYDLIFESRFLAQLFLSFFFSDVRWQTHWQMNMGAGTRMHARITQTAMLTLTLTGYFNIREMNRNDFNLVGNCIQCTISKNHINYTCGSFVKTQRIWFHMQIFYINFICVEVLYIIYSMLLYEICINENECAHSVDKLWRAGERGGKWTRHSNIHTCRTH